MFFNRTMVYKKKPIQKKIVFVSVDYVKIIEINAVHT